ncbi:MAG: amino acid ABC transporter permease [Anaerolineae bacterium]
MAMPPEDMGPPKSQVGVVGWIRKNLFSSWYNTLLTFFALWLIYTIGGRALVWAVTAARWGVITQNLRLFMIGPYPPDQAWRVWLCLVLASGLFGLSAGVWRGTVQRLGIGLAALFAFLLLLPFGPATRVWLGANLVALIAGFGLGRRRPVKGRWVLVAWLIGFALVLVVLQGFRGSAWLPEVGTHQWGGLLLTFMLALVSIVASFPLGVLLALGRRSRQPVISLLSTVYIEVVRGVPLVTILFMAQIMVPLFLPAEMRIANVTRVIIGMTLFSAAYLAENVRGGLQAIPSGQIEAAQALGFNNVLVTFLIVLPQALRLVIPPNVGLFISLFKDTTLAAIVAQLELLSIGRSVLAQPEWLGRQTEVYLFIAAIFFVFSYVMSYASYRLEVALGVGKR